MKRLNKETILKLFQFIEKILEENPIEYLALSSFGMKTLNVINYLKETNQYDDSDYLDTEHYLTNHYFSDEYIRSEITEEKLITYSFSDLEAYFTSNEKLTATGYKLASEFLESDYCTEGQYQSFLNVILAYGEEVKLSEEAKLQLKDYKNNL